MSQLMNSCGCVFCFLLGGSLGCKAQLGSVARWGVRARTGSSPEGAREAGPAPACGEPPALPRAPGVPARAYGRPLVRPRGWCHARAWAAAHARRVALRCRWRRQRNKCAFAPLEGALRVGRGQSDAPRAQLGVATRHVPTPATGARRGARARRRCRGARCNGISASSGERERIWRDGRGGRGHRAERARGSARPRAVPQSHRMGGRREGSYHARHRVLLVRVRRRARWLDVPPPFLCVGARARAQCRRRLFSRLLTRNLYWERSPSHLGQGESDTAAARTLSLSIDALADDMACVCELAGGGAPIHLVGHSMGGYCALRVASRRPELVASLTLVGSRAQASHPYKLIEVALMSLVVMLFGVIRPIADRLMEMMFGPAWVRNHPEAARKWHAHFAALPRRTLRAVWGVATVRSMSDAELRAIRCPVLVVHGEMDDSVPIDDARVTAARCPELRRVAMLPAVGHTPAIEAPAEVIALLAEFIDESMRLSSPAGGSLK